MGAVESTFKSGDLVKMSGDIKSLKRLQEGHGGWCSGMELLLGKVGVVVGVNLMDDVIVKYEELSNQKLRFHPSAIKRVDQFSVGDAVKILDDIEKVKRYQKNHGGWNTKMASFLGKIGTVRQVFPDGDLVVSVSRKTFLFNPLCCKKISQSMRVDEEVDSESITKMMAQLLSMNSDFTSFLTFMQGHREVSYTRDQRFAIGDTVKIIEDIEKLQIYQEGFGGRNDEMASILGKTARIKLVLPNGALLVLVSSSMCSLNPKCCEKIAYSDDSYSDDSDSDSDSDSETLSNMQQKLLSNRISNTALDGFVEDAANGNIQKVREFIKNRPSEIDKKSSGTTALQIASGNGHQKIVSMLLEAGANLEIEDEDKDTALHYSALGDEPEIMELLLSKGSNVKAVNKGHRSALHMAVEQDSVKCVRVLLKHSAPVNIKDDYGDSPLHDAIRKENNAIVHLLISHSEIDFTIRNEHGFNTLHHAAFHGNNFATERILKKKRDIVDVRKDDGFSALHIAAINGYRNVANTLLTVGQAQLDIRCKNQQTPLLLAVREFHVGSIELLISKGAEVNVEDVNGDTCLQLVISKRKRRIHKDSKILKKICTELNLNRDEPHWFIIACYLVNRGANLYHKNHQGIMPLDILDDQSLGDKLKNFASKSTNERPKKKHTARPQTVINECLLCSDKQATILFQPCSHVLICVDCSNKNTIKKCMKCKEPIINKMAI